MRASFHPSACTGRVAENWGVDNGSAHRSLLLEQGIECGTGVQGPGWSGGPPAGGIQNRLGSEQLAFVAGVLGPHRCQQDLPALPAGRGIEVLAVPADVEVLAAFFAPRGKLDLQRWGRLVPAIEAANHRRRLAGGDLPGATRTALLALFPLFLVIVVVVTGLAVLHDSSSCSPVWASRSGVPSPRIRSFISLRNLLNLSIFSPIGAPMDGRIRRG